jgi:ribonuclease HI
LPPHIALAKITGHLNSPAFRTQAGIPGTGLLYYKDTLLKPSATIKEHLMGFHEGTTAAPGLSETDRCQILGQAPDINILTWLLTQAVLTTQTHKPAPHAALTQPPTIESSLPTLLGPDNTTYTPLNPTPPQPIPWQPLHNPEAWTFTDGSYKDENPRQGASVIHSPTNTTTYIDASGQEETQTIMRAKLVAIYFALNKYKHSQLLGIFTESQTSLHAIQNELQRPSRTAYHHHKPLITAIIDSLLYRAELGLPTILHKIREHTNIRGNNLADAAAKRVVADWDGIPENQKLAVTIGRQAEQPPYWVMYTKTPPTPPIRLATCPLSATLRQPWWTIPEDERL